ncbi:MAG: GMC family oxidoreductase [Chloroflexota bacterium]|nr:GMC family oxidoreductase [Chloroflexota bacterium]
MPQIADIADVLVIGAGASGGAFCWSLSESGAKVVCLEQGGWVPLDAFPTDTAASAIHWQTDFNPNPNLRRLIDDYPVDESETPISPLMYNAVGGSLIHWGSHFPRFHPSDFKVKTLDGVAVDWPMSYEELEPYYDLNDRMHGVSGLKGDPAYPPKPDRPTPPLSLGHSGEVLARGFNKLGWHWWPSDNAIPSTEYAGQSPDHGGFLRSMTSSDIVYWPKALRKGVQLKTHARVREILINSEGKAYGAAYYDSDGNLQVQKAKVVVMAANGVGTTRILLNSKSSLFPDGMANSTGLLGKNLMHHPCGMVVGLFEESFQPKGGPRGSSMLSQEFYETDPTRGFVRGYDLQVLGSEQGPLASSLGGLLGLPVPWGQSHHEEFAERFGHTIGISIMTEDLPEEQNRVTLDTHRTDTDGIPGAKINYTVSDNTHRMLDHGIARATEVLEAAGATKILSSHMRRNCGWHLLGTARMGDNPNESVVDRWGRTHDVPNLFIIDGSTFATSACINPTSTIEALALRTADYLKGEGNSTLG